MKKFTKELVNELADKLLIGLTDEENKQVLDEFDVIDANIELINRIPNIEKIEPIKSAIKPNTKRARPCFAWNFANSSSGQNIKGRRNRMLR